MSLTTGAATEDRRSAVTTALLLLAALEAVVTSALLPAAGLSWDDLVNHFVVTNAVIGLSLALAGWPIARQRPENPVGWWLLAGGCLWGATSTGFVVLASVSAAGWSVTPGWRTFATVTNGSWTWGVALCIPMALLLFPDGRLPGTRWRWVVALVAASSVLLTMTAVLDPQGGMNHDAGVPGYPAWPGAAGYAWLGGLAGVLLPASYLALPVALVVRYRRGTDLARRQLLWPVLAVLGLTVCFALAPLLGDDAFVAVGVLPLILVPASVAIAVLRHQLLDIRLVVSRSILYLVLTAAVAAVYIGLVGLLDRTVRGDVPVGSSLVAASVVAVGFNPARLWLQQRVDRTLYGLRNDPVRALATVGALLEQSPVASAGGLDDVLRGLCDALRLPGAAVVGPGGDVARHGRTGDAPVAVPLRQGEEVVGTLLVGLRRGETRLSAADFRVISLLAAPVAVAVQAGRLAEELGRSRERVITGREEERRRIRRDLHDGLGPMLTGVSLNADAALHLVEVEPRRSAALLETIRDQAVGAVEEVRRLVYGLRPPVLDALGLADALREHVLALRSRTDGQPLTVTVDVPEPLGELPAAPEVAAYRIVTEALTNVARHSTGSAARVSLRRDTGSLLLEVADDGRPAGRWQPGVGLAAMRERATELGGTCRIDQDGGGVRVAVRLPLGPTESAPVPVAGLAGAEA
jgi:two-component system NarL family sensor kinase